MLQRFMPPLIRIARIAFLALALAALVSPHVEVLSGGRGAAAIAPAQRITAPRGIVVAQEARAARIGTEILQKGGNAVDAAVAVGFAMAVTYPRAGNIGGGGFMLIHRADRNEDAAIDYRETAPAATTRTTFLDQNGNADPAKSRSSALGIGVPGTVAGLALAQQKFGSGRFSLADLIAPAIELARAGIPVEDDTADSLPSAAVRFARWPAATKIFLKGNGFPLGPGDRLVQTDLAATLATIARDGPSAFYDGPIAEKIAAAVAANGGLMTREDLKNYRAVEREPVRGTYRGYEIVSMPPPSSGGVILIEMLNMLEGYDLRALGAQSPPALHLMIEAMRRAYADRALFLGDPDAVKVPVKNLIAKPYAVVLRAGIDPERARPSLEIRPGEPPFREGDNTTHYSVIDRFGNAVSNTYTLNFSYGVGMVAEGTGILLNNELDDFAAKPEAPNAYGLIGYEANAPGPGKRPLSSMTPTIVLKDGKPFLVTGSPGGSRIITTALQVIVDIIDFDMTVTDAVTAPRLHHQWLPDIVFVERAFPAQAVAALEARGHKVSADPPWSSANSIAVTPSGLVGAADPRTRGALAVGY